MKKSLLTLALIASAFGYAGAETLIESASFDFSDYPVGEIADYQGMNGGKNPAWATMDTNYPGKKIFVCGGQMGNADLGNPGNFNPGVSVVNLGGNVGNVMAINFCESKFNTYAKEQFGLTYDLVPQASSFPGWIDLTFVLRDMPRGTRFRVDILMNIFDNTMKNGKPTGTFADQIFARNADNGTPDDNNLSALPITLAPFTSDVPKAETGWYYDPGLWLKYSLEDRTIYDDKYFPYHVTMKILNTYTRSSTLFIKSVKVYALDTAATDFSRESNVEDGYYMTINGMTGVEGIEANEEAPVEYFNLQGIRVENPSNGVFVKKQGNKASKVMFR